MIKSIKVKNFKLFEKEVSIPLTNINLFTGINGKGKSTALQVFLTMNQSPIHNRTTNSIILNGLNVKLGSFDDVKNSNISSSESINFSFEYDEFVITYFLKQEDLGNTDLVIDKIKVEGEIDGEESKFEIKRTSEGYKVNKELENKSFPTGLFDLFINDVTLQTSDNNKDCEKVRSSLNLNRIHYVSADRIGPKTYYSNKSLGNFITVGPLGEDTVNVLHKSGDELIDAELFESTFKYFDDDIENAGKTVSDNVNYWLDKIFQGAEVKVEPIKEEDLLKLRIKSESSSKYYKPTNVGYGFSYSLPIIVAGLIAKPGEIMIVENPEAHLHPHAQSILAKFLAFISKNNVQVLIESHSEHILNGLRIALHDEIIDKESIGILYFDNTEDGHFTKIDLDENGGINTWPNDFFDQSTKDLNYLLGI